MDSHLSLIAAIADERVIGRNNKLPWHVKSDLANFRSLTLNKPVIMGRKTFESLGSPLDQRENIVITRDPFFSAPGVYVFRSLDDGLQFAREIPADEIMVIGGEQIFEATLETSNRMYLTLIRQLIADGDAYFPDFDKSQWDEVEKRVLPTLEDEPVAEFVRLERKIKSVA